MKKATLKCVWKKAAALCLAAVTAMSLAACGSQGTENGVEETKDFVYVPEYIQLGEGENANYYDMMMSGNSLYYPSSSWDEETMTTETKLCAYSLETRTVVDTPFVLTENRNINTYTIVADGSLYTVESEWPQEPGPDGSYQEKNLLCKYDANGTKVMEQEITKLLSTEEGYSRYISAMCLDAEGRMYLKCEEKIYLFDAEGKQQGEISIDSGWIDSMGMGKDGKVYIAYTDYNSATGGNMLGVLDFAGKKIGATYSNFPSNNGDLTVGLEKDFLVQDGSRVYEYDLATQTTEELFSWLDCDINGSYVQYMGVLEDGRILAMMSDWNTGASEIACLSKKDASSIPQKEQITIGILSEDMDLQAAAVAFNKQSDTYHVNLKSYYDRNSGAEDAWTDAITRMNNDIISGSNCPDIIDISLMNVASLASKGVLEDYTPYLEKSTVLNKEDFFQEVLDCYTYDDKIISIPGTFSLTTIAAKASEVGTEMGWTLEEMVAYSKEHPEAVLFDNASKPYMMMVMMMYNQNEFVDWTTGECKFDTEEFKQLLEFVNSFPMEYEWSEDEPSTPVKIQTGEVLLYPISIYELNSIQEYEATFGEPVTYIGFPNSNGGSGCYLSGNQLYAITSKSQNKEGAWAFIEHYLSQEEENRHMWGLPSLKKRFEKLVEEETKVEYVLDENGEPYLDENGEPITTNGGGGIGYGDWEYTYHIVTQEEVATIRELISVAQPSSTSNDEITTIINEEAEGYYQGQKSVDDVANIIQSRVKIFVNENR